MFKWMSVDTWLISLLSIGYLVLLFYVAYWGQKQVTAKWRSNPYIFSLGLGVSCTSWAFYGIIGQVAATGQWLAPIYIGTICCFLFGWPLLYRMLKISKEQNLTSIADFIACRYDKAPYIATLVSIIALIATIPYLALQLRAIGHSFDLVTGSYQTGATTTTMVTFTLIVFAILFGARHISATKQNQGLACAIAFSSIVKLVAILSVGIFITYVVFNGFSDIASQAEQLPRTPQAETSAYLTVSQVLLGFVTIFITPQLYHMIVIENKHESQLRQARWLYPLYLILINLFVFPIAMAGEITFPGGAINADTYILTLPLYYQVEWLSILVYIGGLAAATSMVIIASVVLSTMVTTEVITPNLLRFQFLKTENQPQMKDLILNLRRISIGVILLLSLMFERLVNQQSQLSTIGLLSFVLLAQFAPAVIAALYWRQASSVGAMIGLLVGSIVWAYALLLPILLPNSDIVSNGLFNLSWLKPGALFGLEHLGSVTNGTLFSLFANVLCFVFISKFTSRSVSEKLQAEIFVKKQQHQLSYKLSYGDLDKLLHRFIGEEGVAKLAELKPTKYSASSQAPIALIEFTQRQLAAVLGTASTRLVINAATGNQEVNALLEEVAHIVDEANQIFEFNRELLQAGVENIDQGICVIDADMRLVAWNRRYIELLDYPESFIAAGMPVEQLIEYNIQRKVIIGDDIEELIRRRVDHMKAGGRHYTHRVMPSGLVLEIRGQSMPGGGFVSTFTDITRHIEAEKLLQQANETLERKVSERTYELSVAKAEAEKVNNSKTRFLAAASHDLMQPFSALSLFTDMLKQKVTEPETKQLADNIQSSLNVVEGLLSDLVEISKLDTKTQLPQMSTFALSEVLTPLINEFKLVAKEKDVIFRTPNTSVWVNSDKRLLRRIIQNFLSNAFHYCSINSYSVDKVLIGVRHTAGQIRLEVWDTGPGIPKEKQNSIFTEFERLETNRDKPGLGLGLAISDRIANILRLPLTVHSEEFKGSVFSITMDKQKPLATEPVNPIVETEKTNVFERLKVVIIDNDELLLNALSAQLTSWGCSVLGVKSGKQLRALNTSTDTPDLIIADFHLDHGENGITLVTQVNQELNIDIPCIVCSADPSESLRQKCSDAGFSYIRKPVKALGLKRVIKQSLQKTFIT